VGNILFKKRKETLVKNTIPGEIDDLKFDSVNSYELVITEYKTVALFRKHDAYYNILENGKNCK